ncbi:MAG: prolyl-tRNA synthetase associated domain-containing protein [Robiginitomaculum sp.]|nr:prolyl-tRNA synthetase associated domain-containing protein [Robiginitomaculum sp.]
MSVSRAELFAFLDKLGISHHTTTHEPVFTVEESAKINASLPGGHTKNLFLKDKKGRFFLISALASTQIHINSLSKTLGCARLSFGSADAMHQILGVTPGSVTALSLINDTDKRVTFVVDSALLTESPIYFHPLLNNASTAILPDDLLRFANATEHPHVLVDFSASNLS